MAFFYDFFMGGTLYFINKNNLVYYVLGPF
jgi:hypothetical protein